MSFKLAFFIGILSIVLQSVNFLFADDQQDALKSYIRSFGKEEKIEIQDRWFSADKGYHIIGSTIGTTLVGQISLKHFNNSVKKSQLIAAGTTFTFGFAKEIYDSKRQNNYFSWKDLAANGVGIIIGILLLGIN